jgi:Protein of unknown function (DUF1800)
MKRFCGILSAVLLIGGLARTGAGRANDREAADTTPASWTNDLTPVAAADWNYRRAAHLLERAGFGGTPEEIQRLASLTPAQAVDSLVDYAAVDASSLPAFQPSGIYPHGYRLVSLQQILPGLASGQGQALGIDATQKGALPYQPAVNEFYTLLISEYSEMRRAGQWWAERMVRTPRPLEEKLTLFWHDHFATSQEKVLHYDLMLAQNETLRHHASGNFHDLLVAVAQDPAMLIWLDNKDNVKGKPNENFAREVMELFTMGEGQGYTEHDIREMARAFTGWTMRPVQKVTDDARFVDDPGLHDGGAKTILHETGNFNGYDAINIILKQPQPSRFLSRKLYRYFVREEIAPEVNAKLAKVLVDANYELKPLLKTLFLSRDFYARESVGTQIKSPVQFVVSTCRKLGLQSIPGIPDFTETTTNLGQSLFFPPNVAGWPSGRSWINPATLLVRGNGAQMLLFPDPATYGAPDKVVNEGYRIIPLKYAQYKIQAYIWDAEQQRMAPVSLAQYDRYLAGIDAGSMKAMNGTKADAKKSDAAMSGSMSGPPSAEKSQMSKLASTERYNLAVGLYAGFVEGYNRVKAIPRTTADVDLVAMARVDKATTASEAVDCFCRRLLSVDLSPERHRAIVAFLQDELGSDKIDYTAKGLALTLRRTVHLILSAPEFQLS